MLAPILAALLSASPNVGEIAPDFTVKDIDGKELNLAKLVEQGPVIIAFIPKAFTNGCTKEMQSYRDRYEEIQKLKGKVIAVSMDDVPTLKKWRAELKAPQTFVADPDGALTKLFDAKMPVVGMAKRHTFVIGPGRKVVEHTEGSESIDPSKAVAACSLHKPEAAPK
jgi:thioredoxin-dependent peroxiredoxin